jgi:TRAP-type mannitol/chloroaromatic compound transport system permease small subunit
VFFMLPAIALLAWMTWPYFMESFVRHEVSATPGGLLRWPVKFLMPLGFFLLTLQGLSELVKRVALLRGIITPTDVVTGYERPEQ